MRNRIALFVEFSALGLDLCLWVIYNFRTCFLFLKKRKQVYCISHRSAVSYEVGKRRLFMRLFLIAGLCSVACFGCSVAPELDQKSDEDQVASVQQPICTRTWVSVSAGYEHTCGIMSDATLWCWGRNDSGQLGVGDTWNGYKVPAQVFTEGAVKVSAKGSHTCAIVNYPTTGNLWCWGSNLRKEVGHPSASYVTSPYRITGVAEPVKDVAVGTLNTCIIDANNDMKCWGDRNYCQTGTLSATPTYTPTLVPTMYSGDTWPGQVGKMSVMNGTICGVGQDYSARCWGRNLYRNLGNNSSVSYTCTPVTPTLPFTLTDQVSIGSGFTCWSDLNDDYVPHCAGFNYYSELGRGYKTTTSPYYEAVPDGIDQSYLQGNIVQIEGGYGLNAVARDQFGYVYTWGYGLYGSLGNGTFGERSTPARVLYSGSPIVASDVSAGSDHNCAIKSDGSVLYCMGNNGYGQIGDGTTTNRNTPVAIVCQ